MPSPILIVGAGPVGLSLALGLARYGTRSILIDREMEISQHSKAPGIHARTLEIFAQWEVADEILGEGRFLRAPVAHSGSTGKPLAKLWLSDLEDECRFAGLGVLEQTSTERILLRAARSSGLCEMRFGNELIGFTQNDSEVTATIRCEDGEYRLQTSILVGCDGAGSTVREILEIPFDGITYPVDAVLADLRLEDERDSLPYPRLAEDDERLMLAVRLETGNWRVVSIIRADPENVDSDPGVSDTMLKKIVASTLGSGDHERVWSSRFKLHRRCVPSFRQGNVLLAGDAAHLNSPIGGQGMNSGIHDAHNLAWKLATLFEGGDRENLLASYHQERHDQVTREINPFTDRMTRAALAPPLVRALGGHAARLISKVKRIRRPMLRRLSMLEGSYRSSPLLFEGGGSVGERVRDVMLQRGPRRARLHELIGLGPALIFMDRAPMEPGASGDALSVVIGDGEWVDRGGLLSKQIGAGRVALVRPDQIIGWIGEPESFADLERAVSRALGRRLA